MCKHIYLEHDSTTSPTRDGFEIIFLIADQNVKIKEPEIK